MDSLSVRSAAQHLGVSKQEVRRRLSAGTLRGEKLSGVWLVDPTSLPNVPAGRGRPLSPASAWLLAEAAGGKPLERVNPVQRHRTIRRLAELSRRPDPLPLLRSWMAQRAAPLRLSASELGAVRADPRIALSGVSDRRSGISATDMVEGYVLERDIEHVMRDHLLVPAGAGRANVLLRVAGSLPEQLPWLIVAADLAEGGPREAQQAEHLLNERLGDGS